MPRGVTLLELVVVLALVALLAAIGTPRAGALLDTVATERAARRVVAAHRVARFTAIARRSVTLVTVTADSLAVRAVRGRDTIAVWRTPGPAADGVSLSGPEPPLAFAPTGLPLGLGNATFRLARGRASRAVVISRLGRTRIAPGS